MKLKKINGCIGWQNGATKNSGCFLFNVDTKTAKNTTAALKNRCPQSLAYCEDVRKGCEKYCWIKN